MLFTVKDQEQTFWCWAAVAEAVDVYFGGSKRQCEIANEVLRRSNCCSDGESGDEPVRLQIALAALGRLQRALPRPLTFEEVTREIDRGFPVCVRLGFFGGGGHFVVISGYSVTPKGRCLVTVEDSARESSPPIEYEQLRDDYMMSGGKWTGTFLVRP